jgi:hypothetical protein
MKSRLLPIALFAFTLPAAHAMEIDFSTNRECVVDYAMNNLEAKSEPVVGDFIVASGDQAKKPADQAKFAFPLSRYFKVDAQGKPLVGKALFIAWTLYSPATKTYKPLIPYANPALTTIIGRSFLLYQIPELQASTDGNMFTNLTLVQADNDTVLIRLDETFHRGDDDAGGFHAIQLRCTQPVKK